MQICVCVHMRHIHMIIGLISCLSYFYVTNIPIKIPLSMCLSPSCIIHNYSLENPKLNESGFSSSSSINRDRLYLLALCLATLGLS